MPATWLVIWLFVTRYLTLLFQSSSFPGRNPSRSWYTPYRSFPCVHESSRPPEVICGNWHVPIQPEGVNGFTSEVYPFQ